MFLLADQPVIKYIGENVRITSAYTTTEYAYSAVRKMTYELDESTDINNVVQEQSVPFSHERESIIFSSTDKELHVQIFSVKGYIVKNFTVHKNESFKFDLGTLSPDIYMVVVNGVTYKIYKR